MKVQATARVQVTLELLCGGVWDDDCKLDQVFMQGAKEVVGRLRALLAPTPVSIIGEPLVVAVLTSREGG